MRATLSQPQPGGGSRASKEVPVTVRWSARVAGSAIALLAMVATINSSAMAQEATPVAQVSSPSRPAHIHSGNCVELGDVVMPLNDLAVPVGEGVGQTDEAAQAESSFTTVPMTLDAILGADHAIN